MALAQVLDSVGQGALDRGAFPSLYLYPGNGGGGSRVRQRSKEDVTEGLDKLEKGAKL
jgi:hypothetical protein